MRWASAQPSGSEESVWSGVSSPVSPSWVKLLSELSSSFVT